MCKSMCLLQVFESLDGMMSSKFHVRNFPKEVPRVSDLKTGDLAVGLRGLGVWMT